MAEGVDMGALIVVVLSVCLMAILVLAVAVTIRTRTRRRNALRVPDQPRALEAELLFAGPDHIPPDPPNEPNHLATDTQPVQVVDDPEGDDAELVTTGSSLRCRTRYTPRQE